MPISQEIESPPGERELVGIPLVGSVLTAADRMARRSDRWMAMMLLLVLLLFCGYVITGLQTQLSESRLSSAKAQESVVGFYKETAAAQLIQARESADAMLKLSDAVKGLQNTVDRIDRQQSNLQPNR